MKIKDILKETKEKIINPWIVRLEATRGCNTGCSFCAIHTVPKGKEFMSVKTAIKVAKSLSSFGAHRQEWGMRGEPLLNPNIYKIMSIFRKYNPDSSIMLYSNGIILDKDKLQNLFDSGINTMTIDCYTERNYLKALDEYKDFNPIDFYEDKENKLNPWQRTKPNVKRVFILKDYGVDISGEKRQRVITNVAGNVDFDIASKNNLNIAKLEEPLQKKCSFPFRDITITWEGKVILCCKDWSSLKVLFDIMNDKRSLKEYWYNDDNLNKIRLLLYNKNRDFTPCKYCDYNGGMRLSFLPKLKILSEKEGRVLLKQVQDLDLEHKEEKSLREKEGRQPYYEK